ncbi:MAG: hypothetical protein HQL51_11730 [Magnetococcales bacterium]|nr:hypothetical protein [Magnetococcales bacterium]
MKLVTLLNGIPLALLALFFLKAILAAASSRDATDAYFKRERIQTGKKFHNLFGIPNDNLQ